MTSRTSPQQRDRPRRFALQLPVYFRKLDSPEWLEGKTDNISCTGMLFHSSSRIDPDTTLDMRLQVALGVKGKGPTEIHCKCTVVRLEQRIMPEDPIGLAVAIRDYRIVGRH